MAEKWDPALGDGALPFIARRSTCTSCHSVLRRSTAKRDYWLRDHPGDLMYAAVKAAPGPAIGGTQPHPPAQTEMRPVTIFILCRRCYAIYVSPGRRLNER